MIFFNWDKLKRACNGDCKKIVTYFERIVLKQKISMACHYKPLMATDKRNWLVNPEEIVKNVDNATISERCMYYYIASRRNYIDYRNDDIRFAFTYAIDADILPKLEHNRLLTIENNKIYLKYE